MCQGYKQIRIRKTPFAVRNGGLPKSGCPDRLYVLAKSRRMNAPSWVVDEEHSEKLEVV